MLPANATSAIVTSTLHRLKPLIQSKWYSQVLLPLLLLPPPTQKNNAVETEKETRTEPQLCREALLASGSGLIRSTGVIDPSWQAGRQLQSIGSNSIPHKISLVVPAVNSNRHHHAFRATRPYIQQYSHKKNKCNALSVKSKSTKIHLPWPKRIFKSWKHL